MSKTWLAIIFLLPFFEVLEGPALKGPATVPEVVGDVVASEELWVDSIYNSLDQKEKIGQLIMIRAHSNRGPDFELKVEQIIKRYKVGGVIFFQGTAIRQAMLTNRYQEVANVPLFVAMDAETGLGFRLKSTTMSFPPMIALGAIREEQHIYNMGLEIARQCRRLGVHINFAPVVDVNNNPLNPVIHTRSFGEDRYNVASKGYYYMRGLQDGNVMACAKHFPGHGDTDMDSHYSLPVIQHPIDRLDSIELYPFRVLFRGGVQSAMVAHIHLPELDSTPNLPATLSGDIVSGLLKEQLEFDGLIISDGMEMQGAVIRGNPLGEEEAMTLSAGVDIILLPRDVGATIKKVEQYINSGLLDTLQLRRKVRKVLRSKYRLGLSQLQEINLAGLSADLNPPAALAQKKILIEKALTLVRDKDSLLPLRRLDTLDIATLSIGVEKTTTFQQTINRFAAASNYHVGHIVSKAMHSKLLRALQKKELVVVGIHNISHNHEKHYNIDRSAIKFLNELAQKTQVIVAVFGTPYSLKYFDFIDPLIAAYEETEEAQDLTAQGIVGVFAFSGQLPVTASSKSRLGMGVITKPLFRFGFEMPERMDLRSDSLRRIGQLMKEALRAKATPGAVILVAKEGRIVYEKAFGYHTYRKRLPVKTTDLYDLASLTKCLSTTLAIMKLYEEGKIELFQNLSHYLPELDTTNKGKVMIYDVLGHRGGLVPWIPFYEQTVTPSRRNPRPMPEYYRRQPSGDFKVRVASRLYMHQDFVDSMWTQIRESRLIEGKKYIYSDLGFYLLADVVKRITGQPLDVYVWNNFYKPLGLKATGYNPWQWMNLSRVVPSEEDTYFRRQRVHGYVHDMGAAMMGGVSGHAGLFSNVREVAILMQMLLNGGEYSGRRYLKEQTIRLFTSRHDLATRRGLGFDMKELDFDRVKNMSEKASPLTFGHLGFTGTVAWADPAHDLVFVLLTNRTYPSMRNYKWGKENYRPKTQALVYNALMHRFSH